MRRRVCSSAVGTDRCLPAEFRWRPEGKRDSRSVAVPLNGEIWNKLAIDGYAAGVVSYLLLVRLRARQSRNCCRQQRLAPLR